MTLKRIRTIEVASHPGERVCIAGWLYSLRQMGGINFLVIRDGWGTVQAVAETEAELSSLLEYEGGLESVLSVEGLVLAMPQAPGGVELHDLHIEVITPVTDILPVSLNKRKITANISTLLDHAVVTNRHLERRAILRLSAGVMSAFRSILNIRDFTEIQTPKIVASATESGANVFKLDYFGRDAYLAQSPQFYKQIMVGSLSASSRWVRFSEQNHMTQHDISTNMSAWMLSLDLLRTTSQSWRSCVT